MLESVSKKKQYARQNQTANRLECCFVDGMAFKLNKNAEKSINSFPRLCDITEEMSSWLIMSVVEIRHQDGKPYRGSTSKHILDGIQ